MDIPEDFPKEPPLAALSGAHPKLAVVFQDGVYKTPPRQNSCRLH